MFKKFLKIFRNPKPAPPPISPKLQAEMDKFLVAIQNRPVHRALSRAIIDATPDDELELLVVDNLCAIIGADEREEWEIVQSFTPEQQAIYTTWIVEAEIWECGLNQFYLKSAGRYSELVVSGFQNIGALEFAKLIHEANTLFAHLRPDLAKSKEATSKTLNVSHKHNSLDELDNEFYELSLTENLHDLRTLYILKYPQAFAQTP